MSPSPMTRPAREVFDDHLRLADAGDVEADLSRNYHPACVVLIDDGVYRGHDGVRQLADRLARELPSGRFEYRVRRVADRFAMLAWTARARGAEVTDGVDSFVIEGGKIVCQTIHYTVRPTG